jgi:bifunctional UDP-N-acetylglucosamine pyrophosphorylase/glucosamine-1-phosphate N-acetyltransferase
MMCRDSLSRHDGPVLVLTGDAPLMRPGHFAPCSTNSRAQNAACVIGTAETEYNHGLGRIVRRDGRVLKIVEQKDGTPAELAIKEINVDATSSTAVRCSRRSANQPNNQQRNITSPTARRFS